MGKRAAVYVRISKDEAGLGLGVERHEQECRVMAARLGFEVTEVFADNDVSAEKARRRPGFDDLMEAVRNDETDVVLTWHTDRLYRRPRELEDIIDLFGAKDVPVHTVQTGPLDLATPAGRMQARILGSVARHEGEQKAARLRSKFDQMAANGDAPGGRAPYGYDRRPSEPGYFINEAEAAHVRWMAEMVLDGRSLMWIAKASDDKGVPTKQGKPWHHSTVRAIVIGPAVAGLRIHRREIAGEGSWEPVLDRATWEAARGILADPRRKRQRPAESYPLSGLLRSGNGVRLVGRAYDSPDGRRTRAYKTAAGVRPFVQVDANKVEELIFEVILQHFDQVSLDAGSETLTVPEIETVEHEIDELAQLRGEGVIELREWLAAREPLLRRLETAKAAAPKMRKPDLLLTKKGALRKAWPDLGVEDRRRILASAISHVTVLPAGGRGRWAKVSDRIEIAWAN
jgi:site-specific DNA recombinase